MQISESGMGNYVGSEKTKRTGNDARPFLFPEPPG